MRLTGGVEHYLPARPRRIYCIFYIDGIATNSPGSEGAGRLFHQICKAAGQPWYKWERKPQKGIFKIRKTKKTTYGDNYRRFNGRRAGQINRKLHEILHGSKTLDSSGTGTAACRTSQPHTGSFYYKRPAKSGLTTTFYALLRNHDSFINNIHTLEREKAGELPNITQEILPRATLPITRENLKQ